MHLDDMAYFGLIARAGGISEAARQNQISKSLLCRRLKQLEEHLGIVLVERDSRRFELTRVGVLYAQHCTQVLDQADAAHQLVAGFRDEPQGTLSISTPIAFSEQWLSHQLPGFLTLYPRINISLHASSEPHELKTIDTDILLAPFHSLPDTRLYAKALITVSDILVCNPDYARRQPIYKLADLPAHCLYARQDGSAEPSWQLSSPYEEPLRLQISPRMTSNSLASLLACAKSNDGIALLPNHYCRESLQRGELVQLLPHITGPSRTLYAFYKSPRQKNRLTDLFLTYLEQLLQLPERTVMPI